MKKITMIILVLMLQILEASNYNYKIGAEYSQSVQISKYTKKVDTVIPDEPNPEPVLAELIINPSTSTYNGGNIEILTDNSTALPTINTDRAWLYGFDNSFISFTITENAKVSIYIQNYGGASSVVKLISDNGDLVDSNGNLILNGDYGFSVANSGWYEIPFTLLAGNYRILNFGATSSYVAYINEIKAELPNIFELPAGQIAITINDYDFHGERNAMYSLIDNDNSLPSNTYGRAFLVGDSNSFINMTVTEDAKVSLYIENYNGTNSSIKITSASGDIIDSNGNLMLNGDYIFSVVNSGWYEVPFTLPTGDYIISTLGSTGSYAAHINEIKAESPNIFELPAGQIAITINDYDFHDERNAMYSLIDNDISLPTNTYDRPWLVGSSNGFINMTVTEDAKVSLYIENYNGANSSIKITPASGNVFDSSGNITSSTYYVFSVASSGWYNFPFTLLAGDYIISNIGTTGNHALHVNEIKAELP